MLLSVLGDDPVFVIGMGSSGTRMVVRILEDLGFFMGGRLATNDFAEPLEVSLGLHSFVDEFRYHVPLTLHWRTLVASHLPELLTFWRDELPTLYRSGGYADSRWGMKDPRLTFLVHLYRERFPEATVLHVVRDPRDVACTKISERWENLPAVRDADYWMRVWASVVSVADAQCRDARSFLTLRYEDLCLNRGHAVEELSGVLAVPEARVRSSVTAIARVGRINKDPSIIIPEDVREVARRFGYW